MNGEYSSCLNSVHTVFDELASFCGSLVDQSIVSSLEKIDDDSLDFTARIQNSIKLAKSKSQEQSRPSTQSRSGLDVNAEGESDEAVFRKFMQSMCTQASLNRLPIPEPEVFSGDPLQYFSWENSFHALISSRCVPENERIYYLQKYVSGEAKQCIDGFLSSCTPEAYDESLVLLKERFGWYFGHLLYFGQFLSFALFGHLGSN